jgi:Ca-activated chloride channel family protein
MKLSVNDPKLTAYALGEIENEAERAAIEAAVAESAELSQAVREIREMGALLSAGLGAEAVPELSELDKARMEQVPAAEPAKGRPLVARILSWPALSAVAAAAAVALFVFVLVPPYGTMNQPVGDAFVDNDRIVELEVAPPPPEQRAEPGRDKPKVEGMLPAVVSMELKKDVDSAEPSASVADEVFELSPFEVSTGDQVGYLSTNAVAGKAMQASRVVDIRQRTEPWNTESYDTIEETGFRSPLVAPLSTFSIDVDTASYANVRRFLNQGQLPPADAVRIEELINYFPYVDAPPTQSLEEGGDPFAVHMAQTIAPWNTDHHLLRIALKGYEMPWEERPASNLVFLLDVSGSMSDPNKLPLVKEAMDLLVRRLDGRDRVAIVVYAGASGLVLPSTTANNRETIAHALQNLSAGGSTNAGAGIQLAYKVAREHFIEDGNNRVILCTDGDFNVGTTNQGELADIADAQAEQGVSLTILGFGMGNYKDDMLEELSNKGKGSYAYVDSSAEARKVFLEDLTSNLFKIAKDVKIQVEFNPAQVEAYRLIGYENRRLNAEDFNDDKKKAGDIGPGHSVVALYEIIPAGTSADLPTVDPLRYQDAGAATSRSTEVATVKLRYKQPDGDTSKLISRAVKRDDLTSLDRASADFRFGAAVAAFGMRLSGSGYIGEFSYAEIEQLAAAAIGTDPGGHRSEFTSLVRKAEALKTAPEQVPTR